MALFRNVKRGTATNDSAAAGNIGEYISAVTPGTTATVTVTIASPAVVTWTSHGLVAGSIFRFTTTGALPTGLTAGTAYYVISSGLTTDAFQLSATPFGSAINTSGSQSGVHSGFARSELLTTNTASNIAAISLTAGDWDVEGNMWIAQTGSPTISYILGWISTTSATIPTVPNGGAITQIQCTGLNNSGIPTGKLRVSISATTTVYVSGAVGFTGGTSIYAYGFIGARRVR